MSITIKKGKKGPLPTFLIIQQRTVYHKYQAGVKEFLSSGFVFNKKLRRPLSGIRGA